jgi:hypothetical protein
MGPSGGLILMAIDIQSEQSYVSEVWLLPAETIVEVDPIGDALCPIPHLYCRFNGAEGHTPTRPDSELLALASAPKPSTPRAASRAMPRYLNLQNESGGVSPNPLQQVHNSALVSPAGP